MSHWRLPGLALLPACLLLAGPAAAATRVDLVLDEPAPGRSVAWPVTTGVPFPRGQLTDMAHCRLVDDTGRECLLQARVAATWDAQCSSIRWLTIDFLAQPGRRYALEFGPDVQRTEGASPLRVEPGEPVRVATGVLTASLSRRGPAALGPLGLDLDGDGVLRPDEAVARGGDDGDHVAIDPAGRAATSARDGDDRQVVVEATGPVRACIRVDGWYTGPEGQRLAGYRTRYHFFAGLGLVKVVDEFRITSSTRGVRWRDVCFALRLLPGGGEQTVAVDASGAPGNQVVSVRPGPGGRSVASFQATYRHYGNPECRGGVVETGPDGERTVRQAEQVGEWLQVANARAALTGSLRWFWQQFPKEWEATSDSLRLHLWSPRGGELDFSADGVRRFCGPAGARYLLDWQGVRAPQSPIERYFYFAGRSALERGDADGRGIRKHHEFWLHLAPAAQAEQGREYGQLAAQPPLALARGAWNCATDVFGPLAPRPSGAADEAIVDRLFDLGRDAQDAFGDYGWWLFGAGPHYSYQWDAQAQRHYADPRRFDFHTYQKETQLWWCYVRSGERKFLDWALPSENHWVDVAVAHEPVQFHSEWRGGWRAPALLHWPRGDWAIDSTVHYLRHHDTGEAWLRGQAQFWATYHRTLETTTLAYYLTGDERFNDVLAYWTAYWGDLAGKTSAAPDLQPWHREQAWYRPTPPGAPPATWAEMIRDYAPFTSGSRHQLTLLFNLATLYEHTWDARIGQALREYAAAFLDPEHRMGVWRSQDNRGPARAEAPLLAHYWVPALWKYARATNDPRMPEVFRRYFAACLDADPFDEDVGIYSNVHIGYAYYFTRDPRHLRPALAELARLRPHAAPLARPEDLGPRLYNPYAPAKAFTAVPRLLWAVQEAEKAGVAVPPPPVTRPQRAPLAFAKAAGTAVALTLWGHDAEVRLLGPDGLPCRDAQVRTRQATSAIQPFDRTLPGFAVYRHEVALPATAPAGWYVLTPTLEMALLALSGAPGAVCNATVPVAVHPGESWLWKVPAGVQELRLESAAPRSLRVVGPDGQERPARVAPTSGVVALQAADAGRVVRIEGVGKDVAWMRLAGLAAEHCWLATTETALAQDVGRSLTGAALPPALPAPPRDLYVAGRFGKGLVIVPGRTLHLPDHERSDGPARRLFDLRQGTLEFWVKRLWDERLAPVPRVTFLTNGLVEAWSPWKLPLAEWAHVAVVWRPLPRSADGDPEQTVVHVYVNGLDQAYYRSTQWEGYGNRPFALPKGGKWLEEFVGRAPPGTAYVLDEVRLSRVPRYADLAVEFGGQQTFNPVHFTPPTAPFPADAETTLLFRFDDDLKDAAGRTRKPLEGRVPGTAK